LAELLLLFGELEIQALPPAIGVSTWLIDILEMLIATEW
jgi:hypothetical protein